MLLLSVDTSDCFISVALVDEQKVWAYTQAQMERGQAEQLFLLIDETFKKAGTDISKIDGIVVTVGPGSFTGIRIGLAAAKGLGMALNVPVMGVTCFEMWQYGIEEPVKVVLDTRRGDFYVQSFDECGRGDLPKVLSLDDLTQALPFKAVGNAAAELKTSEGCTVLDVQPIFAVSAARVALCRLNAPLKAEPLYLREADVSI